VAQPKLELTAVDQTRAAFASVAKNLDQLTVRVQATGARIKGILGASFAGISGAVAFTALTETAKEAEQASARVAAVLRATGHAAGIAQKEIDELAESLAETTQFDDESIRNAASQLLVFKNVQGDTFREALKLSADVAAFFGEDLPSAAAKLGRSLEDPETAFGLLRRAGILLTEQQKDMIKEMAEAGNVAGAQAVIIDKLKGAFEGTAAAINTGMTKATADAKKALDEFLESLGRSEAVGGSFKRGLEGVKTLLVQMKAAVEDGPAAVRNLGSSLIGFSADLLGKVNPALGVTLELMSKLAKAEDDRKRRSSGIIGGGPLDPKVIEAAAAEQKAAQERDAAYVKAREAAKKAAEEAKKASAEAQRAAKADQERFTNAKLSLEEQAAAVEDITEFEKTRIAIEQGKLGKTAQANRDQLLALAANIDLLRDEKKVREEIERVIEAQNREDAERSRTESERRAAVRDSIVALIDPLEQYRKKLVAVREAAEKGDITPEQQLEAEFKIQELIDEALKLEAQVDKTKSVAEELGLTFVSAFEDAVVEGEKFRDVVRALEKDIIRVLSRKFVTEPLANSAGKFAEELTKGGSGDFVSDLLKKTGEFFSGLFRAEGGPVAAGSPYIVGERGPELFVPKASGHIVPNTDLLTSIASSTKALTSMFRAEGGPVAANSPYIVGEKGPELFVPKASGNIVPNSSLLTSIASSAKALTAMFRATGGPVTAGAPYIVGEEGPELFVPAASGNVTPTRETRSGGNHINITINVPQGIRHDTAAQVAASVGRAVRSAMRKNG